MTTLFKPPSKARKPDFARHAWLVLVPVAILAGMGFLALSQDRRLVQQQATEHAQALAGDLADRAWTELTEPTGRGGTNTFWFTIDNMGRLISPPPLSPPPNPQPLDPAHLSPEQARAWQTLQRAGESADDRNDRLGEVYADFLNSSPPARFAAVAQYQRGLWASRHGQTAVAVAAFEAVVQRFPDAEGESGLPLEPLARLKLLNLSAGSTNSSREQRPIAMSNFCASLLGPPSSYSIVLLDQLLKVETDPQARGTIENAIETWNHDQLVREIAASALPNAIKAPGDSSLSGDSFPQLRYQGMESAYRTFTAPVSESLAKPQFNQIFWFQIPGSALEEPVLKNPKGASYSAAIKWNHDTQLTGGALRSISGSWLACLGDLKGPRHSICCRRESDVRDRLGRLMTGWRSIPDYLGVEINLAGKTNLISGDLRFWGTGGSGKGGGGSRFTESNVPTPIIASTSVGDPLTGQLSVLIHLTSPYQLYVVQRVRMFLFGTLIAVAVVTALLGLMAVQRAFLRQERLAELQSNFVSSVTHELRAPIASVRLMAEGLERGKVAEPARQQEYYRFIVQECRRLSAMIENVLDFSRIEQGRKQYESEPTDLQALVQQTVKLLEPYAAERKVALILSVPVGRVPPPGASPQPSVDGQAIQQALVNLIDNAVKHSPAGAAVRIGLEFNPATGEAEDESIHRETLQLWVEDDGPGIPATEHERIFERFYRLGSELNRETTGVGIGLSIVKHIVDAHHGRIIVTSEVGKGSRFTIEIPVNEKETKT